MEDCIFCKISKGDIPSCKIYEDENVFAFLDINPKLEGHTLVIPKKHCKNISDATMETLDSIMVAVKKITDHYIKDVGFTGFKLQVNNGESAGQEVSHLHFHIMPYGKKFRLSVVEMVDILKM